MSTKRENILRKARALFTQTTENGCTESEAMAALNILNKLMEEYDLTIDDVRQEVKETNFGIRARHFGSFEDLTNVHEVAHCFMEIADYWDCVTWIRKEDLIFFGSREDTEFAFMMVAMIRAALDTEWKAFRTELIKKQRGAKNIAGHRTSFMAGMTNRIRERLIELKAARTEASSAHSGTALVVLKNQVVQQRMDAYMEATGQTQKVAVVRSKIDHEKSFEAGILAGDRVDLGSTKIDDGYKKIAN